MSIASPCCPSLATSSRDASPIPCSSKLRTSVIPRSPPTTASAGLPLLGSHHAPGAAHGEPPGCLRRSDRSRELRTSHARAASGCSDRGRGVSFELLPAAPPPFAPARSRRRPACVGGRPAPPCAATARHRRWRRPLLVCDRGPPAVRRAPRSPRRRDPGRQGGAPLGPPLRGRGDRRYRIERRECARCRGGRDPGRGHAAVGLHYRLDAALPTPRPPSC